MSDEVRVGGIDIHNVNRDNIVCEVHIHDYFATIAIKLSNTDITLFTTLEEIAAIRRILGGW
jgi:hypothetical protein